jgi:hypothetical protein
MQNIVHIKKLKIILTTFLDLSRVKLSDLDNDEKVNYIEINLLRDNIEDL